MKMKRMFIAMVLVLSLVLCMACSKNEENNTKDNPTPTEAAATEAVKPSETTEPVTTPEVREAPTPEVTEAPTPEVTEAPAREGGMEDYNGSLGSVEITWGCPHSDVIPDLDIQLCNAEGFTIEAISEYTNVMYTDDRDLIDCVRKVYAIPDYFTPSSIYISGNNPDTANEDISSVIFEIVLAKDNTVDSYAYASSSSLAECYRRADTGVWYYDIPIDWTEGDIGGTGSCYVGDSSTEYDYSDLVDNDVEYGFGEGELIISWDSVSGEELPDLLINVYDANNNMMDYSSDEDVRGMNSYRVASGIEPVLVEIMGNAPSFESTQILSDAVFTITLLKYPEGSSSFPEVCIVDELELIPDCYIRAETGIMYFSIPIDWNALNVAGISAS